MIFFHQNFDEFWTQKYLKLRYLLSCYKTSAWHKATTCVVVLYSAVQENIFPLMRYKTIHEIQKISENANQSWLSDTVFQNLKIRISKLRRVW